jgi:hypothetical protein
MANRGSASIEAILDGCVPQNPQSVFAKLDVEGTEYRVLPAVRERAELFTGLAIEFHDTDICASLFNSQLHQLRRHFEIVHVHGNNYGDLSVDGAAADSGDLVSQSVDVRRAGDDVRRSCAARRSRLA